MSCKNAQRICIAAIIEALCIGSCSQRELFSHKRCCLNHGSTHAWLQDPGETCWSRSCQLGALQCHGHNHNRHIHSRVQHHACHSCDQVPCCIRSQLPSLVGTCWRRKCQWGAWQCHGSSHTRAQHLHHAFLCTHSKCVDSRMP